MSAARRGAYAKGRVRREAILHAANDVFAAQGFHKAALSTIAKQVGLSEPGLLHHFPSKEHLLLELLAMRHEHDAERVARALEHHEGFLDALLGLCRENQGTPGLVRLFAILAAESVDDDHPAHDWSSSATGPCATGSSRASQPSSARGGSTRSSTRTASPPS
jgi:AcrR family transcriptional regulator